MIQHSSLTRNDPTLVTYTQWSNIPHSHTIIQHTPHLHARIQYFSPVLVPQDVTTQSQVSNNCTSSWWGRARKRSEHSGMRKTCTYASLLAGMRKTHTCAHLLAYSQNTYMCTLTRIFAKHIHAHTYSHIRKTHTYAHLLAYARFCATQAGILGFINFKAKVRHLQWHYKHACVQIHIYAYTLMMSTEVRTRILGYIQAPYYCLCFAQAHHHTNIFACVRT